MAGGMRLCKEITNPEKLIEWGIKGVYNEYDSLERTYCSCGHVEPSKLYVCPACGNTEFVAVKDYQGHIMPSDKSDFEFDSSDKTIYQKLNWLTVRRNADPTKVDFVEQPSKSIVFSETGSYWSWNRNRIADDELNETIKKFQSKFSENMQFAIEVYDILGLPLYETRNVINILNVKNKACVKTVDELIKNNEKNFLAFLLKNFNNSSSWTNADIMMRTVGIPYFLEADRNNQSVLSQISSNMYQFKNNLNQLENKWRQLPIDVQLVVLHYFRQGLIDANQLFNMTFISPDLLKNYPDIQAKMIKKYFANFSLSSGRYYYHHNTRMNQSIEDMYQFYVNNGVPIMADTFDLRAWRSMVNGNAIKELGYDNGQVDKILENMDTNPLDSLLELGRLRRPRQKKAETP